MNVPNTLLCLGALDRLAVQPLDGETLSYIKNIVDENAGNEKTRDKWLVIDIIPQSGDVSYEVRAYAEMSVFNVSVMLCAIRDIAGLDTCSLSSELRYAALHQLRLMHSNINYSVTADYRNERG